MPVHSLSCAGALATCVLIAATSASAPAAGQDAIVYDSVGVNGITLAYRDVGTGEPLVLLHGFAGSARQWPPGMLDSLAAHFRVIAPDMRGRGLSLDPTGDFTPAQIAADVFALLDSLGIGSVRALGHSAGAMALLHMATAQPDRVNRMILIAGTPWLPEHTRRMLVGNDPANVPPEALEAMARRAGHAGGADQMRRILQAMYDARDNYDSMNFTPPRLATIEASTLIVHGDRDDLIPVEMAFQLYDAIPDAHLWIMPGAGHEDLVASPDLPWQRRLVETTIEFLSGAWDAQ